MSNVIIHDGAKLVGREFITFGKNVIIDSYTFIAASAQCPIHIGSYVHIAAFTSIAGGPVTLGDYTNIGAGSRLIAGSDNFRDALIGPSIPAQFRNVNRAGITLKKHATLGANCVVLTGVTMGEGSIAGAATLINADTDPWKLYVGAPMRAIGTRDKAMCLHLEDLLSKSRNI